MARLQGAAIVLAVATAPAFGDESFTMTVADAFTISDRGIVLTGQVKSGTAVTGDRVCVPLQSGETVASEILSIEIFRKLVERAEKGQMVGVLVGPEIKAKAVEKNATLHTEC